ncbi:P-loop NTPase fold protein [Lactococcus garvieae]|uniref:P-loop NTPase fold protein n=3 Tax=Lactococcus garvieae TaxID=1363 RepID=UPI0023ED104E|nr:P-loop NTPase fold protein [Lactococcus garvieae]
MSNKFKKIEFNYIETKDYAERYAKLIQEKKTYFLDGKWGSGKTIFIDEIKKYLPKDVKMVAVDLWKATDNSSVIEKFFIELHKIWGAVMKFGIFLLLTLSILSSNSFWIFGESWIKAIFWALTAGVILFQFFGRKSDDVYLWLFKKLSLEKQVLVIDDFDRVSPERQEEAYKLFNLLNGRSPILFVGDYDKLVKNEDNYLQKIIDEKISLPYVLHPSQITKNVNLPLSIKSLFELENRVARELSHFIVVANKEIKNKYGKIQYEQQLLIIYLYLFHPKIYVDDLKHGRLPEGYKDYTDDSKNSFGDVKNLMVKVFQANHNIPKDFLSNPQAYFLYENATNLSIGELESIFENDEQLQQQLEQVDEEDENYREVSYYIESINLETWCKHADRVEKIAIKQLKNRVKPNELTKYIFQQKLSLLENEVREGSRNLNAGMGEANGFVTFANENNVKAIEDIPDGTFFGRNEVSALETPYIFSRLDAFFKENEIDISQQFYFYHEFLDIKGKIVGYDSRSLTRTLPRVNEEVIIEKLSENVNRLLNTSKYINERFPEQIVIAKLGFGYHQLDKTNLNNLKDIILELPDDAFKYFWNFYFIKPYQHKDKIELSGREKLEFDNEFSDNVLNRLVEIDKRIGETT